MLGFSRVLRWLLPLGFARRRLGRGRADSPACERPARPKPRSFAGGCFWCVEEAFEKVPGVITAVSGFIGGTVANPSYEQVMTKATGHAEAVQVTYDPGKVTYQQLVDWFWRNIDPLDAGGQFCDKGNPYRSGIFYHDDEQKKIAEKLQAGAAGVGTFQAADRHRDHGGRPVLPGRGLSPGLLQEEREPVPVLQARLRPRAAAGAGLGQGNAAAEQLIGSGEFGAWLKPGSARRTVRAAGAGRW